MIEPAVPDQALFGFAGRSTRNRFGEVFDPFNIDRDDITMVGAGYQQWVAQLPLDVRFGYDVGLAGRFGGKSEFIPENAAES